MDPQDRLAATVKASKMLLAHFDKVLSDRQASVLRLKTAVFPLYGIRWAAPVVKAIGSRGLNKLLARPRNSQLPEKDYNSLASLLCDALAGDFDFPPCWAAWRLLVERFELDLRFSLSLLLPVIHWVVLQGWPEPFQLAIISLTELKMRAAVLPQSEIAFSVWEAAVLAFAIQGDTSELALRGFPPMPRRS